MRFDEQAGSTRKGAEAEAEAKAEADDVPMALPCDVITSSSGRQCILADDLSVDPMCSNAGCQRHDTAVATPAVKAGAAALELADRWLCDTGAAYDLVSGSVAKSGWDSAIDVKPVPFQTANGTHTTNKALRTNGNAWFGSSGTAGLRHARRQPLCTLTGAALHERRLQFRLDQGQ